MKRLLPLLLLAACGPLQERTSFPLVVAAQLPEGPNEHGWRIALDEAAIDLGPVKFFEGDVLLSRRWSPWELLVPVARAHPGHYVPGESKGEWLGHLHVDLLAPPSSVGTVEAVTGHFGSMQLTLRSVELRGVATKDDETIAFATSLALEQPLEGIGAVHELTVEPVFARLMIDVEKWLARVDFTTAVDPDEDGTFTFDPTTQAFNALSRAVADTGAYKIAFAPEESQP